MFTVVAAPVTALMHRLSFSHKFMLAGGLMWAALAVVLTPGIARMGLEYRSLEVRQGGMLALDRSYAALTGVMKHREKLLRHMRGIEIQEPAELTQGRDEVDRAIEALANESGEGASPMTKAVSDQWAEIRGKSEGRYSPVQANSDHAELLRRMTRQIVETSVKAGLFEDSDPKAQQLSVLRAYKVPALMRLSSEALSLGIFATSQPLNNEDRQRLAYLGQSMLDLQEEIGLGLSEEVGTHAQTSPEVLAASEALATAVPPLANLLLNRGVLHPEDGLSAADLRPLAEATRQATAALANVVAAELRDGLAQRNSVLLWEIALQLTAIFATLGVACYVFVGFWKASHETIEALVATTEKVIAGDLSVDAKVRSRDELARIADRFNQLTRTLRNVIGRIAEHSDRVASMTDDLHQSAATVMQNSEEQSVAATATSASVQQIAVSIEAMTENARDLTRVAGDGLRQLTAGERAVVDLDGQMRDMRSVMDSIAAVSAEFVADAHKVAEMTMRVREISGQTNLLALNAAIEAARAGDAGRGFAVVADEVRKLAEYVASTASQIDSVMKGMQTQSDLVTQTIGAGGQHLKSAEVGLQKVSEALSATGVAVRQTHAEADAINHAIAEQRSATQEIARNIEGIAEMADGTHTAIGSVYELICELGNMSKLMDGQVAHFQMR